ncbi:hypothetical protein ACFVVQ_07675 [Paenibacillus chitinolyticus]|uniref:hypothetical protein n=1 Tax=Paenibacillus chitinolyticus TaxID=79263 RepID=UPI0036D92C81
MMEKRGIHTDTWTRVEMRYNLPRMKRVSELTVEDFAAANQYYVVTDTSQLPNHIKGIVDGMNADRIEWKDVGWREKDKIRECAFAQAINLGNSLLSKLENTDIGTFIYTPMKQLGELTS